MSAGTSRDDADFWGLTLFERVRFHSRLATYYARRARQNAAKADRGSRLATILAAISIGAALFALLIQLAQSIWGTP